MRRAAGYVADALIGMGTKGWAGMARPPCSWMAATLQRSERSGGMRPAQEEPEEVAAAGRDLLADDDLEAVPAAGRHVPCRQGGVDALVIGDGDDVQVGLLLHVPKDGVDAGHAIRGGAVDVQVGTAEADRTRRGGGWQGRRCIAHRMSSQIGNMIVHHCSGAGATMRLDGPGLRGQERGHTRSHGLARLGHDQIEERDLVRAVTGPPGDGHLAGDARLEGHQGGPDGQAAPARRRAPWAARPRRSAGRRRCPPGRRRGPRPAAGDCR